MELTNPDALRAQLAVLNIFQEAGVPVGDVHSIGEISRAWAHYLVRASDLAPALEALMDEGVLALEPGSQDVLTLTPTGERWLHQQPRWLKYRLLAPRIARTRPGCARSARPYPPALRRRRDDDTTPRMEGC